MKFIKIIQKQDNKMLPSPYFEMKQKNQTNGKYEICTVDGNKKFNTIVGRITEIKKDIFEYTGNNNTKTKVDIVKITFYVKETDEYLLLQMGFGNITRSLLSSLGSADFTQELEIGLYSNKGGFHCVYIQQNGQKLAWNHNFKELRKLVKPLKNQKGEIEKYDYSLLNDEFINFAEELGKKKMYVVQKTGQEKKNKNDKPMKNATTQDVVDDLPF